MKFFIVMLLSLIVSSAFATNRPPEVCLQAALRCIGNNEEICVEDPDAEAGMRCEINQEELDVCARALKICSRY